MGKRFGSAAVVFAASAVVATMLAVPTAPAATAAPAPKVPALSGPQTEYIVLAKNGANQAAVAKAVKAAGGQLTKAQVAKGSYLAKAPKAGFISRVAQQPVLEGAATNRQIGSAPPAAVKPKPEPEKVTGADRGTAPKPKPGTNRARNAPNPEPLADRQWDMNQVGANSTGSYAKNQGNKKVLVGVIDTGIDASHPDIAPNFNTKLSRNFTTDIPSVDGPCEVESCVDPANVDDGGHGSHVASTIAAPLNGRGIGGVAPKVSLVNLRAGQDSGSFFLGPVMDALFTAGDIGVSVVNMSFFVDPYWMNCASNPADSPERQVEQRTVRTGMERALTYANGKGVTLVSSLGNELTDLGKPTVDTDSPNFPPGEAYERKVDNTCQVLPVEGPNVIATASLAPSLRKSYFSNFGTEQNDISAPGGDAYDTPDGKADVSRQVLAAYPTNVAIAEGAIEKPGDEPNNPAVIRECKDGKCAYYQYLQGTSMASPHTAGVAALLVSRYGKPNAQGYLAMPPKDVKANLVDSAVKKACPNPRDYKYVTPRGTFVHRCDGPVAKNGFYGAGIVNANNAVS